MLKSNTGRAFLKVALFTSLVALFVLSCNRGDTDGGEGNDDAGTGVQLVSDGGFGASLKIEAPDELEVGDVDGFRVFLKDPAGAALPFIRIFCESEQGIAIIEPSRAGVAFENTDAQGQLSGQVGGLAPGSYLFECRAEEGFNLVDRVTIIVRGDIPPGVTGFPGAAGGNLGGGRFVEEPVAPGAGAPGGVSIEFETVDGTSREAAAIDLFNDVSCDDDLTTADNEPFGPDRILVTISNPLDEPINLGQLTFAPRDGSGVISVIQPSGTQIAARASQTFESFLTQVTGTSGGAGVDAITLTKVWAGTSTQIGTGTFGVDISTTAVGAESGDSFSINDAGTIQVANFNNCAG